MKYFKNIKVAVRLPLVVILALVALIVYALMAMNTMGQVRIGSDAQKEIAHDRSMLGSVAPPGAFLLEAELTAKDVRIAAMTGDTEQLVAASTELAEQVESFRAVHAALSEELRADEVDALAQVRETGNDYIEVIESAFLPAAAAGDAAALAEIDGQLRQLSVAHGQAADAAAALFGEQIVTDTTSAVDLADGRRTMLWVLLIATLIIVGAAATVVTMSVLKPLDELRHNMEDIAAGDGSNNATRLDADRKDEFGQVAGAFNTFADKLVAYADEVAVNAKVAEARSIEVSQAADIAAENMNTVAVATTELSAAASEIARSASDASRTAETAVRAADHANQLMEQLAESSSRIGEVVESIRGIAAQTTMLALNATIEAARAGEAGRGFAVVASEVKDLAAETGTATADIVGRVEAIHVDTQAALAALGEVAQVITEISSSQSVIAAAVEEQAATTSEIDRSLTEAVTAVNQLASRTGSAPAANHNFTTAA